MLRYGILTTGAALAITLAAAAPAAAQKPHPRPAHAQKEHGKQQRELERETRPVERARAGAPAFCRSGAGHPVYGRQWCLEKGFGLGGTYRWGRAGWDSIPLSRRYGAGTVITQPTLAQVLGSVILGRLAERAQLLGAAGPLTGRWLTPAGGGSAVTIRAAGIPLAELVDRNGDGRADLVLLNLGH